MSILYRELFFVRYIEKKLRFSSLQKWENIIKL